MHQADLVARLQLLHEEAFHWAMKCTQSNLEDAKDVMQMVYLKVLDGRAKYRDQGTLKAWLFRLIRNTAIDLFRKQSRTLVMDRPEQESGFDDIESKFFQQEKHKRLRAVLKSLSERQQQILHLVFFDEFTVEEAATVMNISVGTARTHYDRGKKSLKAKWQKTVDS